jgi:hypothetical protein
MTHGYKRNGTDPLFATLNAAKGEVFGLYQERGFPPPGRQNPISAVKVAHALMLRAIAAAKKKNDQIDASKIADCLRCAFQPECHMARTQIRDRRRTLRYGTCWCARWCR